MGVFLYFDPSPNDETIGNGGLREHSMACLRQAGAKPAGMHSLSRIIGVSQSVPIVC